MLLLQDRFFPRFFARVLCHLQEIYEAQNSWTFLHRNLWAELKMHMNVQAKVWTFVNQPLAKFFFSPPIQTFASDQRVQKFNLLTAHLSFHGRLNWWLTKPMGTHLELAQKIKLIWVQMLLFQFRLLQLIARFAIFSHTQFSDTAHDLPMLGIGFWSPLCIMPSVELLPSKCAFLLHVLVAAVYSSEINLCHDLLREKQQQEERGD